MTRARLPALRRNLAVAIGNSGDPRVVEALEEPAGDRPSIEDAMVQEHVAWARRRIRRQDLPPPPPGREADTE
jgi:epoxyqueuosine reductase QueG